MKLYFHLLKETQEFRGRKTNNGLGLDNEYRANIRMNTRRNKDGTKFELYIRSNPIFKIFSNTSAHFIQHIIR